MPSYDQGYQAGAKQGTVLLAVGASAAACTTDLSQEASNMTAGTNCVYANTDNRFDYSGPRTIFATVTLDTNDTGYIFFQGTSTTETAMRADGSGGLIITHEGSDIGAFTPAGLSSTARAFHVAWVTEPNPDTTGASDAYISWIITWDVTNTVAGRAGPWTHTAKSTDNTIALYGAATTVGASRFTGTTTRIGFHQRAMTLTEIFCDYETAAGTLSTEVATGNEAIPYTLAMGLGDRNELYGPANAWAAHNHASLRRRTVTGRSMRLDPVTIDTTTHTSNSRVRLVTWDSLYRWRMGWLWSLPVAPTVSHVWVRMHCDLWVTTGAAVPTGLRIYSANRPPVLADAAGSEPYEHNYIGSVVTRDDTAAGLGSWTVEGYLPIARGREGMREGWTYLLAAYAFDPANASANDANARLRINCVQFAPCYRLPDTGEGPALPGESG